MRTFALLALIAATAYADGHLPTSTNSTMVEHHEDHKDDEDMNSAEQLISAIDSVMELFIDESAVNTEGLKQLRSLRIFRLRNLLEMFCEGGDADDVMGPGRRLDGHEGHNNSIFATNSTIAVIDEDGRGEDEGDMMTECLRAFRLLDQIDEYTDKDTTEERKDEITEQWSEAIDDAWSEMFSSDSATSTFAASVASMATSVTLLSF